MLGDGKEGEDRILFKSGQNLDLTKQIANSIKNIEILDLRNQGPNRLRLDQASARLATDNAHTLKLYADLVDDVFLRGNWNVESKVKVGDEWFHNLSSGEVTVLVNNTRMKQNPVDRFDVDMDGGMTPLDVLSIINLINSDFESGASNGDDSASYWDVDGDGSLSPLDVLTIVNILNDGSRQNGEGEGQPAGRAESMFGYDLDPDHPQRKRKR